MLDLDEMACIVRPDLCITLGYLSEGKCAVTCKLRI